MQEKGGEKVGVREFSQFSEMEGEKGEEKVGARGFSQFSEMEKFFEPPTSGSEGQRHIR